MNYLFSTLLFLHDAIHLRGFSKDAGLICLLVLVVACFSLSYYTFNKKISNEISQVIGHSDGFETTEVTREQLAELPSPVAKWLKVSGVVGKENIRTVWIKQKAKMKMKPEQENWNHATAEQYFSIQNPAFVWKVKMKMPPFIRITGRDKFIDGKGEMQIKMLKTDYLSISN